MNWQALSNVPSAVVTATSLFFDHGGARSKPPSASVRLRAANPIRSSGSGAVLAPVVGFAGERTELPAVAVVDPPVRLRKRRAASNAPQSQRLAPHGVVCAVHDRRLRIFGWRASGEIHSLGVYLPETFAGAELLSLPLRTRHEHHATAYGARFRLSGVSAHSDTIPVFGGAGTTGLVADRLQRDAILVELNPQYAEMARKRIRGDAPLFAEVQQCES